MKKKLLLVLATLLVALVFVSCSDKTSSEKVTESRAKEIADEFVTYSYGYQNPKNKNQIAAGVTMVEIFDDTLNDKAIVFSNDPLVSKQISLICKMNIKGEKFSFDDYPMYKEALELYYGKDSNEVVKLTDNINKGMKKVTIGTSVEVKAFKEDDKYIVGKIDKVDVGSYKLTFMCDNKY